MEKRINVSIGCYKEAFGDFELAISVESNHVLTLQESRSAYSGRAKK
ncbi:MAG: hypothetical protein H6Q67_1580 [Firmicutes bacterium]|nr:hypothetical protein [Bacillota bacterium]